MNEYMSVNGVNILFGVLILVAGFLIAGLAKKFLRRALAKLPKFDDTLEGFFASLLKYFIIIVAVMMALSKFGVQTASLIAVFGAASLAIGLALQDTLKSLAAGVMILIFRPFKVGDYVEAAGLAGSVREVTLFTTEMATPDNVKIILANADIWGQPVLNYSANRTRRVDLVVGIAYDDDIGKAKKAVEAVLKKDARVLGEPAPVILVEALSASSVDLVIRAWVNRADFMDTKSDLQKAIKENFAKKGITIPFPTQTMVMVGEDDGSKKAA